MYCGEPRLPALLWVAHHLLLRFTPFLLCYLLHFLGGAQGLLNSPLASGGLGSLAGGGGAADIDICQIAAESEAAVADSIAGGAHAAGARAPHPLLLLGAVQPLTFLL